MIPVELPWIADVIVGKLVLPTGVSDAGLVVSAVSTDTRTLEPGSIFVALKGENHDGHDFLAEAIESGALAAIVEEDDPRALGLGDPPPIPLVMVKETLVALGLLARSVRGKLDLRAAVGITGSTGKTCTKDFLVSVLKRRFSVAAAPGSYNNEIGVPLTVLSADHGSEVLVCEMGARAPGDIDRLVDIVRPDFGVITNVGIAHLGEFRNLENIANTKGELARRMGEDGCLVLNKDDEWSETFSGWTSARVVTFGLSDGADFRGSNVRVDDRGRPEFTLEWPGNRTDIRLPVIGRHNVENALAAAACAGSMDVGRDDISKGLEESSLSKWRLEVLTAPGGYIVINDSYNSNPHSLRAALQAQKDLAGGKRTVAVLGDMAELGSASREAHRQVGRHLPEMGVDVLIAVGDEADEIAKAAVESGMNGGKVFFSRSLDDATEALRRLLKPGDVVLVKASRFLGLERLAKALLIGSEGVEGGKI